MDARTEFGRELVILSVRVMTARNAARRAGEWVWVKELNDLRERLDRALLEEAADQERARREGERQLKLLGD